MLGMRLVKLIEAHSGELCRDLSEQIAKSERTTDFRRIPAEELRLAASEVYRNLGDWLLQKTESDIEARFRSVAARPRLRESDCISSCGHSCFRGTASGIFFAISHSLTMSWLFMANSSCSGC